MDTGDRTELTEATEVTSAAADSEEEDSGVSDGSNLLTRLFLLASEWSQFFAHLTVKKLLIYFDKAN